jgi:hypothetical protein
MKYLIVGKNENQVGEKEIRKVGREKFIEIS